MSKKHVYRAVVLCLVCVVGTWMMWQARGFGAAAKPKGEPAKAKGEGAKPQPAKAEPAKPKAEPAMTHGRVTSEQEEAAIQKAIAFIYKSRNSAGIWEGGSEPKYVDGKATGRQWTGYTALAAYSLLAAGESFQDPKLIKAIDWLKKSRTEGIYALGMRAQVWNLIPMTPEVRSAVRDDGNAVLKAMKGGLFDYYASPGSRIDHSVSQYGVLGMWALLETGWEVPTATWKGMDEAWRKDQGADGSWGYSAGAPKAGKGTATMTAAGVATLFISQQYVHASRGVECSGNIPDPEIEKGMKWMEKNFKEVAEHHPFYCLYGVERIGVASGYKRFGSVDWYQWGARYLLANQTSAGAFVEKNPVGKPDWMGSVANTALGLLFLAKGGSPVIINKLQYEVNGKEGHWNERPRDVANLAHWVGKQAERFFKWQIVSLDKSGDLRDAPILYISGDQALHFSEAEQEVLRKYAKSGGIILGHADCGAKAFSDSFKSLGKKLFHDYEFRELEENHLIYTQQLYKREKWKNRPKVLGLSNGKRELMLLIPEADPGRAWQIQSVGGQAELFQLPADIYYYAIHDKVWTGGGRPE